MFLSCLFRSLGRPQSKYEVVVELVVAVLLVVVVVGVVGVGVVLGGRVVSREVRVVVAAEVEVQTGFVMQVRD